MNVHSRRFLALLIAVAILVTSFVTLDFRAATSQGRTNSQLSAFSSRPDGIQQAAFPPGELRLYVPGDDPFSAALRKELSILLGSGPAFRGVRIEGSPSSTRGEPALMVETSRRAGLWTPVRATGDLEVKAVYASDGDLSWRDDQVVHMENHGQPLRRIKGEFLVEDSTNGLTSVKGYDRHLGRYVAQQVSSSLLKAVENPS